MKIVLLYQCGIANVFRVNRFKRTAEGRNAVRLLQSDYHSCASFAAGAAAAGAMVRTEHCDLAGDVTDAPWNAGRGDLWQDAKRAVGHTVNGD